MRTLRIFTRAGFLGSLLVGLVATMAFYAPSANATTVTRTGVFSDATSCQGHRNAKANAYEGDPRVRVGGCFQYGPGAAGWYYYIYWNL